MIDIWPGPVLSLTGGKKLGSLLAKPDQQDLVVLKEVLETGNVAPVIDRRYALDDVPDAIRYVEEGQARGNVVITI